MDSVTQSVGIDVHKDLLVASINQGKPFTVKNDSKGCRDILKRIPAGSVVALESSGGYERTLVKTLREGKFELKIYNPLSPRRMAQAFGTHAKTDPIDARMLSRFASILPASKPKSQERTQMCDHKRAIEIAKETISQFKQRLKMPELDQEAQKLFKSFIKHSEMLVKEHEKKLQERIAESSCKEDLKLLISVQGIGKVSAAAILLELPEDFRERSAAQIASYAGLAPIDHASGKGQLPSVIRRGNIRLKAALYMPALSLIRCEEWARNLYKRLRDKGKTHDQAIVAVMRRILVRATAVLRRRKPWELQVPKT